MIDWQSVANQGEMFGDSGGGYGESSNSDVAALRKALSAGEGNGGTHGVATPGAAGPLMPESLDEVLHSVTYTEQEFKLWQRIPKSPAYNTAEEYIRLHRVGLGESAFMGEGERPEEEDSSYSREVSMVKFLGTTRRITHQATLVRSVEKAGLVARETKNGVMWLLRQLEEALFFGDSQIVPLQFDGLNRLMIDGGSPVYDMRGAPLSEEVLSGMCAAVRKKGNYGTIDTVYSSIGVKSDLKNKIRDRMRSQFGDKVDFEPKLDNFGDVKLEDNVFIDEGEDKLPVAAGVGNSSKRPLLPILGAAGITTPANGNSKFGASDAGSYYYKIVAINRYGRSAPLTTAAVAVAEGDKVVIPIVDGGQDTTGYIVYRSAVDAADATTCQEAFRVKRTGASQDIEDLNADLPGTSIAFGLETKAETLSWRQLAPMMMIPLATSDLNERWMQVLYGVLRLTAPRHCFRIKNVGRDPNAPQIANIPGLE